MASPSTRPACSKRPRANSAGSPICAPPSRAPPFYLGLIALRQARWEDAVEALTATPEKAGSRPAVLHNLAFALEQLGRLTEAETAYGEAVSKSRDDARPMLGWGSRGAQA